MHRMRDNFLPAYSSPQRSVLGLCEKPLVSKSLYSFMFDYLLLPYGSHPSLKPTEPAAGEGLKVPAGLSEYGWKRVAGEVHNLLLEDLYECEH